MSDTPRMMTAIGFETPGGPDVLMPMERPVPAACFPFPQVFR